MINNHNYYKVLETADLIELLAEVAQKYSRALVTGENGRTVDGYHELMGFLQHEIQQRHEMADRPANAPPPQAGYVFPTDT